jgi:hypothetical protein
MRTREPFVEEPSMIDPAYVITEALHDASGRLVGVVVVGEVLVEDLDQLVTAPRLVQPAADVAGDGVLVPIPLDQHITPEPHVSVIHVAVGHHRLDYDRSRHPVSALIVALRGPGDYHAQGSGYGWADRLDTEWLVASLDIELLVDEPDHLGDCADRSYLPTVVVDDSPHRGVVSQSAAPDLDRGISRARDLSA